MPEGKDTVEHGPDRAGATKPAPRQCTSARSLIVLDAYL
jgi:hypothetical protein